MKKFFSILCFFFVAIAAFSQTENDPVKWETSVEKISDTEYDIIFKATILNEWHLYSQYNPEEGASLPLVISPVEKNPPFQLEGKAEESKTYKEYSDVWEKEETFFKNTATLVQRVKLTNKEITTIKLNLFAQVCKEVCINIDEDFTFSLDGKAAKEEAVIIDEKSKQFSKALTLDLKNKELLKSEATENSSSLWKIFLLGFVGGLLALLTPCVFPMIPLTVSFFTKQSKNKASGISNAVLYGAFIVVIYVLFSVPFHFLDSINPEILNTISTNIWLNIFFFVILVFFAFSFFGFYELTLPSSWGNKMDSASNIGGIIGIFFMALTLAIVSFSCTGPILGSLLAGSLTSDGGAMQLTAGMSGFGLALAFPFALFALFPGWLNSLPKSGGWLNAVKVVLGFLELALAFKFLSNADLVIHLGLLKREVFIGIWILIFVGLALYLFKRIKFPHDGPDKKISFSRAAFGILVISFVIYLIPGTLKTPWWNLNLLSGFPPPQFYSVYEKETDCPLGLDCYKDFEKGIAAAKVQNKPVLLDFTGWACVNCRKVEENIWSDPDIFKVLNEEYVLISLYVDDRKELPEENQFLFLKDNGNTKRIETIGDKWSTFQVVNFKVTAQPYYVQMTPNYAILNRAENSQKITKKSYLEWLKQGKERFRNE
jgi:thiol:disulfide interchange protein DsbD